MKRTLSYGTKLIEYQLSFADRKTLGITVTPERKVVVVAPIGAAKSRINGIVMKRAQWILRQLDYFLAFYPKQQPKKYISGESHLLLGRQYLLKCLPGNPEHVKLTARQIIVTSRTKRRAKELMHSWYAAKAKERLTDLVNEWIERLSSIQKKPTSILVRTMTKRWGSCTAKGKIILNSELIKAPRGCIDYVIVHELCHLIHHNHTIKFFELQEELFPHWQKWKIRLEHLLA